MTSAVPAIRALTVISAPTSPYPGPMSEARVEARIGARRAVPRAPLVGALLGAVALGVALVGPAQVVLHGCVPGEGRLGWLGLRMALLRTSVDCPEGALAWGGSSADSAIVVISVAVPTLAVHALAVASGVSVSALLARAASAIRVVLGAVLRGLPATPRAPWVQATLVVGRARAQVCTRELTGRHLDRGPPAPA